MSQPPNFQNSTKSHLTSLTHQQLSHPSRHKSTPNKMKSELYESLATSQWRKRWTTASPPFLYVQHQSTTTTFLFLRLSKVNIFPNVVVHTKNATLKRALTLQIQSMEKGNQWMWLTPDNMTLLQTCSFWKGSNIFCPHLLALLWENTTSLRKRRPNPPPNHVRVW